MKKHVFEAFLSLQNEKARFWSVFQVYKMKVNVRSAILSFEIGRIVYPIFNEFSWKAFKSNSDRFLEQIFDSQVVCSLETKAFP